MKIRTDAPAAKFRRRSGARKTILEFNFENEYAKTGEQYFARESDLKRSSYLIYVLIEDLGRSGKAQNFTRV